MTKDTTIIMQNLKKTMTNQWKLKATCLALATILTLPIQGQSSDGTKTTPQPQAPVNNVADGIEQENEPKTPVLDKPRIDAILTSSPPIDLLKGVVWDKKRAGSALETIGDLSIGDENRILLIDCSSSLSAHSQLYRSKRIEEESRRQQANTSRRSREESQRNADTTSDIAPNAKREGSEQQEQQEQQEPSPRLAKQTTSTADQPDSSAAVINETSNTNAEQNLPTDGTIRLIPQRPLKGKAKLWVGNYLKVYLFNVNPYKYTVEVNGEQSDYTNGIEDNFSDNTKNSESDNSPADNELISSLSTEAKRIVVSLKSYQTAEKQLQAFTDRVKNNSAPNSTQLESNKSTIIANVAQFLKHLEPEVDALIASINEPEDVSKLVELVAAAKSFKTWVEKVKSLTYTIEGTMMPFKIQSYDQLKITVILKNVQDRSEVEKREYLFPIHGGIKVDQSFGINGHKLFSTQYALKSIPMPDTVYAVATNGEIISTVPVNGVTRDSIQSINQISRKEIIKVEDESKIHLSLSTLTHFYFRLGFVNIGPHLGVGVDLFPEGSTSRRWFTGGSIMFSKGRHRVSLNAGIVHGSVKRLSPTVSVGDFIAESSTEAPTIDVRATSRYFGLTYNVPLVKRETQKPGEANNSSN